MKVILGGFRLAQAVMAALFALGGLALTLIAARLGWDALAGGLAMENAQGVIDHTKFDGIALIDDGTLRRKYGIRAVPYTVVLGPDGFATEQLRGGVGQDRLADALADAR